MSKYTNPPGMFYKGMEVIIDKGLLSLVRVVEGFEKE